MSSILPPSRLSPGIAMFPADSSSSRQRTNKILCMVVTAVTLAYGLAWPFVMLGVAQSLRQPTTPPSSYYPPNYSPPAGAEQQFINIMIVSLIPLVLLLFFAILLGRAGFRMPVAEPVDMSSSYWTVGLFLLSVPAGILSLSAVYPTGIFIWLVSLWRSLLGHLPTPDAITNLSYLLAFLFGPVLAFFAVLIGGIAWGRTTGTRSQRIWQYLARMACILAIGVLVSVFLVIALVLRFFFHPLHLVW